MPDHLRRNRSLTPESESSDNDDDAVGPRPPPAAGASGPSLTAAEEFRLRERAKRLEEEERARAEAGKSKREDWMLVPPSSMDMLASNDPTKIRARGFAQNTRRGGAAADRTGGEQDVSLWTETPEERAKRLDEEVMGKRKRKENASRQESEADRRERLKRERRNEELRSRVDEYNVSRRCPDVAASRGCVWLTVPPSPRRADCFNPLVIDRHFTLKDAGRAARRSE